MNKRHEGHAAAVCNEGSYDMGGYNGASSSLDCVERRNVKDLLHFSTTTTTTTTNSSKKSHWKILNCQLLAGRHGCCAVAVRNRYTVIMGGFHFGPDGNFSYLSSVEIIDTSSSNQHMVRMGPSMTVPRYGCASVAMGQNRIFVLGGHNTDRSNNSVEYWDFPV